MGNQEMYTLDTSNRTVKNTQENSRPVQLAIRLLLRVQLTSHSLLTSVTCEWLALNEFT